MTNNNLEDVVEIIMGQSPASSTCNMDGVGIPLLNGPTEFGSHHPLAVQFTTDAKRLAKPGDILFCVRGSTTGRMNWADQIYAIGRGIGAIRHKQGIEYQPLVRGVIECELSDLLTQATGSTFPNVSASQLSKIRWPALDDAEQRRIAHILGTLDDKIENNRKTAKTLEAMAQAIFQSWFVDFDPVRAKMAGESKESICKRLKLTPEILDLFPDRLVDSELGEIPERWEIKDFSSVSICYDNSRIPLSSNEREKRKGLIPYYGATGIIDYVDQELFDDIYLLLGEDGSVVKPDGTPFIQYIWGKSWVNNHAHVIRGTNSVSTEHLMLFMSTQNITAYVTGAVQLKLNQKNMNRIPFIMAKKDINQYFYLLVADLFSNYRSLNDVSSRLVSCRDTLLPKLISGEVCVPEVEQSTDAIMNGKI
ncbi:restriction endonuclease subunit S [Acidithiobacillus thiooxidans]|uniref:Type I restriction modification DNA specificity domain-containing protein n=1 Tax=Acidithiobacillus thiooxidans TaxID=930 RepID=A0A1C2II44_ACITH|nr:restriction endonuclease subunit S [Acidithiobacillus thiooxidans]OCX75659.1 hypothetical protein A6M23_01690 [Acidithiobacillus thiooxidans]OCX87210.1 hypothetical protein A6P08_03560 [Acidithiobacillus thiooxidans]